MPRPYHGQIQFAESTGVRHDAAALRNLLFGLFVLVCLIAVAHPDYVGVGNRVEPVILGLPFSLTWNIIWVGLSFFAMLAYHFTEKRR